MISSTLDLQENTVTNEHFALNLYLPPFTQNTLSQDTEKALKIDEVRKQLKKIRTHIVIAETDSDHLLLLLAIIVSAVVDIDIKLSVGAKKDEKAWQTLTMTADLGALTHLAEKTSRGFSLF